MDIEAKGGSAPGKTPHNTVNTSYSDKLAKRINSGQSSAKSWRLSTENSQPALYDIPDRAESVNSVGAGIWTVICFFPNGVREPSQITFAVRGG